MINKTFELHKRIKRLSNEKRGHWGEWRSDDHEEQGRGRREEKSDDDEEQGREREERGRECP